MQTIIAFIQQHYGVIGLCLIVVSWLAHLVLSIAYDRTGLGYFLLIILGMLAGIVLCVGKGIALWPAIIVVIGMGALNIVSFIIVFFIGAVLGITTTISDERDR